ncbi:MAG: methionine gamma-lyase [Firmicutes bacterium ADurb.Bin300]|nr:MAG: methionine gamma-lyase [Firmicutes bacterium ADurb.Bin300]HOD02126.1 methionine gamma-lyase family protein [Clostridiales bacterium]
MNGFNINKKIELLAELAERKSTEAFSHIEEITQHNQTAVLRAFIENKVSETHFYPSTGYGYGDRGRDTLDRLWADIMGCEDSIIRYSFASGTHTLCVMLFGVLRKGDTVLCVTGTPYDTIHGVFGIDGNRGSGSLSDFGVKYKQVELMTDGKVDLEAVEKVMKTEKIDAVYIQRSRGYTLRPSLSTEKIGEIVKTVRRRGDAVIMLDNCYGEFVEKTSPFEYDVDIMAGSLIKNAGGGIVKCGGYIAGKKKYVELAAYRMTAPGIGREIGASLGNNRDIFMGIFNAPHVTGEALKTAVFTAHLFEEMGYEVSPLPDEKRADIIQSIMLKEPGKLVAFCKGLQSGSPVDSFVSPEPSLMPGYESKVIMAAGTFTLGSSIELSADAPLREPYAVWLQGGLNYHSAKTAVMLAASRVLEYGE